MQVTLERITVLYFDDVVELKLHDFQEKNLPSNVYSMAESILSDTFHPRAICADGAPVGFAMYQFGEKGAWDEEECTIWRLMIDRDHQNKGIGTAAMPLLLAEV